MMGAGPAVVAGYHQGGFTVACHCVEAATLPVEKGVGVRCSSRHHRPGACFYPPVALLKLSASTVTDMRSTNWAAWRHTPAIAGGVLLNPRAIMGIALAPHGAPPGREHPSIGRVLPSLQSNIRATFVVVPGRRH